MGAIQKYLWRNWWERLAVVLIVVCAIAAAASSGYAAVYQDRVYPGVFVGSYATGGLTGDEVRQRVAAASDTLDQSGLIFVFRDRKVTVPTVVATTDDPDLSYDLINYDIDATVLSALLYGRTGSILQQWKERVWGLIGRAVIVPEYTWRKDAVQELLYKNFASLEQPAISTELVITNGVASVTQDQEGIIFDYERAFNEAQSQLDGLVFSPVMLKLKKDIPILTKEQAEPLVPAVQRALFSVGVSVTYEDESWFWPASTINSLIEIRAEESGSIKLGFSKSHLLEQLEPIVTQLTREPQEPRFAVSSGKVVEFKSPAQGQYVLIEDTWKLWEQQLLLERATELEPVVEIIDPKQEIADLNDLGIAELLGVGTSSFARSPANRRHNIKVGADAVNGTLIPPGEEFSLLKTLGKIDKAAGYLPELVIKGNQTVPEYGGGLCQIGTTTFRGTLAAGLPVTARQNHSYSVSYYYDDQGRPGTDATIYDPAPDYRFKNDTANYVLISTRIEGDELFFEYWGTKDGRTVTQSETRLWDRVSPPPTRYIETLDLPVGKTKCTETPHAGVKAAFDYAITYADGTKNETTFTSQYRPWQEVCLIGVETLSKEVDAVGLNLEDADLSTSTVQ
ncbi:hypothetical protein BK004_02440 [bacterium CG10_46_32]|nr:MAG: hypothetical protein BK004_02440 [bacterium CG10_46_32]